MLNFVLRRLVAIPFILLGMSIVVFLLMKLIPGDAALALLGPYATEQSLETLRRTLGLDQPLIRQFWIWLSHVATGDFGRSVQYNIPVSEILADRALNSALLTVVAFLVAAVVGVALGVTTALYRNSFFDRASVTSALVLANAPPFWLGFVLVFVFALSLRWLPASGMYVVGRPVDAWVVISHLVLPAITAALIPLAVIMRLTRSAMIDILNQQFVTAARARGIPERTVILRHAMRMAWPGIINICGLQLGYIFGTALFSEVVFNWPGIGQLMYSSITSRDVATIQAIVLVVGGLFVLINFTSDVLQALIDPRARRA